MMLELRDRTCLGVAAAGVDRDAPAGHQQAVERQRAGPVRRLEHAALAALRVLALRVRDRPAQRPDHPAPAPTARRPTATARARPPAGRAAARRPRRRVPARRRARGSVRSAIRQDIRTEYQKRGRG